MSLSKGLLSRILVKGSFRGARSTSALFCVATFLSFLLLFCPSSADAQQTQGFLGYVMNSGDGTVTIFAVESDDQTIGNNDHLLSTVKVGSNPMRIAPTPDGHFAYVSSPADNSVWKIDVSDPTNPTAKQIPIPSLGKPGGIAFTTLPKGNLPAAPQFLWIADSVKCEMHVLDASSDKEAIAPIALAQPNGGGGTAACGAGIAFPEVISTADLQTAVFASFNQVSFSGKQPLPSSPYIYGFVAFNLTSFPILSIPLPITGLADPHVISSVELSRGSTNVLLIGDFGNPSATPAVNPSGLAVGTSIDAAGVMHVSFQNQFVKLAANQHPVAIATNALNQQPTFNVFVGVDNPNPSFYAIPLDCSNAGCSVSKPLPGYANDPSTVPYPLQGTASSIAAVPSSCNNPVTNSNQCGTIENIDNSLNSSLVYITEPSGGKPMELVRTNFVSIAPVLPSCIVGGLPAATGSCGAGVTSSSGAQLYDTAVKVSILPTGIAFGPVFSGAPALTWLASCSTTGNAPFTPLQTTPPVYSGTAVPPACLSVDKGTLLGNLIFQGLSMVNPSATLNAQSTATETGNPANAANYECNGTCLPIGPAVQSSDFNVSSGGQQSNAAARRRHYNPNHRNVQRLHPGWERLLDAKQRRDEDKTILLTLHKWQNVSHDDRVRSRKPNVELQRSTE